SRSAFTSSSVSTSRSNGVRFLSSPSSQITRTSRPSGRRMLGGSLICPSSTTATSLEPIPVGPNATRFAHGTHRFSAYWDRLLFMITFSIQGLCGGPSLSTPHQVKRDVLRVSRGGKGEAVAFVCDFLTLVHHPRARVKPFGTIVPGWDCQREVSLASVLEVDGVRFAGFCQRLGRGTGRAALDDRVVRRHVNEVEALDELL